MSKALNPVTSTLIAACMFTPVLAQAQSEQDLAAQDARVIQMQSALEACGNTPNSTILEVCETSLSTIIDIQPKLEFVNEVMISYYVETLVRGTLSDTYFGQRNLNKHCENVEKMWFAKDRASQYFDHPIFAEISTLAVAKKADVMTCRKLGGTPEWAAPL